MNTKQVDIILYHPTRQALLLLSMMTICQIQIWLLLLVHLLPFLFKAILQNCHKGEMCLGTLGSANNTPLLHRN